MTEMETRLQNQNTTTNKQVADLDKTTKDMQQTLGQITSTIDTLNARFARAKVWLETMNLDTISEDAQNATKAAMDSEARNRVFLAQYLEWIKTQHAMLEKQIVTLEAQMKSDGKGTSKGSDATNGAPAKTPDDGGGGGEAKKDGG